MESLNKLAGIAKDNVGFVLLSVLVVAVTVISAYVAEMLIAKKTGTKRREDLKVKRMTIISVLSAIAVILMIFEIPVWFAPGFYKLNFSELPIIIGAFTLGPVVGVVIEFLKILLNLLLEGTDSVFVGEFANFLAGCAFVIPASFIYFIKKNRKNAILGLVVGTIISAVVSGILNAYMLLPKYAELMSKPIGAFIKMGEEKNQLISNMSTFVLFGVVPFNILKCGLVSVGTMLIYKKISHILKG